MSNKIIKYLNKTKVSKRGNINAILFSTETLTYYYVYNVNMKNKDCIIMCEPINKDRPYCELFHVYFDEIENLIGEYYIVNGESFNKPYKKVMERLKKEEDRLLSIIS